MYRTIMAERDANQKALDQVEKATDSEPAKAEELLESDTEAGPTPVGCVAVTRCAPGEAAVEPPHSI